MIEYNKLFHQHVQKIILSRSKCPNNSFYLSRKKILLIHSNANISSCYLLFIVHIYSTRSYRNVHWNEKYYDNMSRRPTRYTTRIKRIIKYNEKLRCVENIDANGLTTMNELITMNSWSECLTWRRIHWLVSLSCFVF